MTEREIERERERERESCNLLLSCPYIGVHSHAFTRAFVDREACISII